MKLSAILRAQRDAKVSERTALIDGLTPETLTDELEAQARSLASDVTSLDERIAEVEATEAREAVAAAARVATNTNVATVVTEQNPSYRKGDASASFFRDLIISQRGDRAAAERLAGSQERAISTTAGAGGEFAPPLWLVEDFVALARAGRVTAGLVQHDALPAGVSSVNLPTVATGTSTAVQATQNSAVSLTDITTSSVSSGITTIAGQQVASLQLLSQSGIPFDNVILADLVSDYNRTLNVQVINGSGTGNQLKGILNTSGINAQTYTQASPTVIGAGQFYSQIVQAINAVQTNRFDSPSVIVMHPRRWNWVLNALDSSNRPLVTPNHYPSFNSPGDASDSPVAQGAAGELLGLPVYVDPSIPTNLGAGTNQDAVIVMKADDLWLYESAIQSASFDATYANQASILFRVLGYAAFIPNRYPKSIAVISGTGLVTPTF